jgi:hypothetical protein
MSATDVARSQFGFVVAAVRSDLYNQRHRIVTRALPSNSG